MTDNGYSSFCSWGWRKLAGVNLRNLFFISFLISCSIIFILMKASQGSSCWSLLSKGRFVGQHTWQPFGCLMHNYTKTEARECLKVKVSNTSGNHVTKQSHVAKQNHVVFLGDSRIRYHYLGWVHIVEGDADYRVKWHANDRFTDPEHNMVVDFLWETFVFPERWEAIVNNWTAPSTDLPDIIVAGSATWTMKEYNGDLKALDMFKANLTALRPALDSLARKTTVLWMLQEPVDDELCKQFGRIFLSNEQINAYNKVAREVLSGSNVILWESALQVSRGFTNYTFDGLHLNPAPLAVDSQIILNLYCNKHMTFDDATCCVEITPHDHMICLLLLSLLVGAFLHVCWTQIYFVDAVATLKSDVNSSSENKYSLQTNRHNFHQETDCSLHTQSDTKDSQIDDVIPNSSSPSQHSMAGSGLLFAGLRNPVVILIFLYFCDRREFLLKEKMAFTWNELILHVLLICFIALYFIRTTKEALAIPREQTDEVKGLLQMVILICLQIDADTSSVSLAYIAARVVVSSYLFLSGFGHFVYFFNTGDYSLARLCTVLFRYNVLTVVLAVALNRPYLSYYFVPFVTLNFILVVVVSAIRPRFNSKSIETEPHGFFCLLLKIGVMYLVITVLYSIQYMSDGAFSVLPSIENHQHLAGDRYTVSYGMTFAVLFLWARRRKVFNESSSEYLFTSCRITWFITLLTIVAFSVYTFTVISCANIVEFKTTHGLISGLPILSILLLRNISGWLRQRTCVVLTWLGRISFEIFVLHFHLWTSFTSKGVLLLVPYSPSLNMCAIYVVMMITANEIHILTRNVTEYFTVSDLKMRLKISTALVCVLASLYVIRVIDFNKYATT